VYANLLKEKLNKHKAQCWLVNTGWGGGPFGVGKRMNLPYTRAMVRAAVDGRLEETQYTTEPTFGLSIPKSCPDVPAELLNPRNAWQDKAAYDRQVANLAERFAKNFEKFDASEAVRAAGPAKAVVSG
ncbi:MAG: phosphoenolpyruvate carboxykinase (ATP), partial [Terriglobales bacterium]